MFLENADQMSAACFFTMNWAIIITMNNGNNMSYNFLPVSETAFSTVSETFFYEHSCCWSQFSEFH